MDLYCPRCGEPWDNDTFHDVAQQNAEEYTPPLPSTVGAILRQPPTTYKLVVEDFYRRGCAALGEPQCEATDSLRAQASAALRDILGDDTDGIASELADGEYFGWFDSDD